jgi:hypothetical protein
MNPRSASGLAKTFAPTIDRAVDVAGAPKAAIGIVALLVLMQETGAAVRAVRADRRQTSMNLAIDSAPSASRSRRWRRQRSPSAAAGSGAGVEGTRPARRDLLVSAVTLGTDLRRGRITTIIRPRL